MEWSGVGGGLNSSLSSLWDVQKKILSQCAGVGKNVKQMNWKMLRLVAGGLATIAMSFG